MGRIYTRVHRLLRLIAAIQSKRGLNAAGLAALCQVHERTIYRDLDTLSASGVPCVFDSESGGYHVGAGFFMPPVELTFEEAMAIVALLEKVGDGDQIPFLGAATRAVEKIRAPAIDRRSERVELRGNASRGEDSRTVARRGAGDNRSD
jgi:predicted DNA-binding transcriptional regulator YafY